MAGEARSDQAFGVWADRRGVVRVRWAPGVCITGELAIAAIAAVDDLNPGRERPLLVEMAGAGTPTRAARERFADRCTASRVALLGVSVVDRVHATFAPRDGSGFAVPTRFFTSEPAALTWLFDDVSGQPTGS